MLVLLLRYLKTKRSFNLRNKRWGNLPAVKGLTQKAKKKHPVVPRQPQKPEKAESPLPSHLLRLGIRFLSRNASGWRCTHRLQGVPEPAGCQLRVFLTVASTVSRRDCNSGIFNKVRAKIKKRPSDQAAALGQFVSCG